MSSDLRFDQRRSIAFGRACNRHKVLIVLCCLIAYGEALLSLTSSFAAAYAARFTGYAMQVYLLYNVHRTILLDIGARSSPSLVDAVKFGLLSVGILCSALGMAYLLQLVFVLNSGSSPQQIFRTIIFISWLPYLFVYLVVFPIIALCFPSLAYDGKLRLVENIRAGRPIWLRTLFSIAVAILPWIILGIIATLALQMIVTSVIAGDLQVFFSGELTSAHALFALMSLPVALFSILALMGVAATLSEIYREQVQLSDSNISGRSGEKT